MARTQLSEHMDRMVNFVEETLVDAYSRNIDLEGQWSVVRVGNFLVVKEDDLCFQIRVGMMAPSDVGDEAVLKFTG